MPNTKRLLTAPFTRLDSTNRMVYGYASTGMIDSYDTIFDPGWWPHAISGYLETRQLTEDHDHERVVGDVPVLEVRNEGLWIGARIASDEAWEKITSNDYNGFSVEVYAYDLEEEEDEHGKLILRFKKYVLNDITVGYPAANKEARFAYLERLEKSDEPWDFDWKRDADNIIAALGWEGLKQATLLQRPDGDPEDRDTYSLPVAKMKEGKLTVFRNALRAAVAVLNGARGDEYDEETHSSLYSQVQEYYSQFGEEAPVLRLQPKDEGDDMSNFTKTVLALLKRLSGNDVDDKAREEIEALEKDLQDDKDRKIGRLSEGLEKVVTRLEELEKAEDDDGDEEEDDEVAKTLGTIEERIGKLEKRLSKSRQPSDSDGDDDDDDGGKPSGSAMNDLIRRTVRNRRGEK